MSDYFSVLFCFHDTQTDVYLNGLPLGIIKGGKFEVHERTLADGSKQPIEIPKDALESVQTALDLVTTMTLPSLKGNG